MLNLLNSATDLISVITSSGADIDAHASFVDAPETFLTSSSVVPGKQNTAILTATTTTIVSTPGASTARNVKIINLRNIDGSVSNDVTVQFSANATLYTLEKCTLLAGEVLTYKEGVWFHYDSNGAVYGTGIPFAAQADMEAGTSAILVVAPSTQHFHPGHPKCWGKATVAAGTPTLAVSYNITSITDTATDQLTVTIANDFSSANYAVSATIEAATTTLSATTTSLTVFVRTSTLLAGSFIIQACEFDIGAATDPASWMWIACGDI